MTTLCRIPHKSFSHLQKKVSNFFGASALSRAPAGMATMKFDLDLIFPIRDAASAELMALKAACLCNAGVIDARQKEIIERRAQKFLAQEAFPAFERGMRAVGSIQAARAARNAHRGLTGLRTA